MSPEVTLCSPVMQFNVVDFPLPRMAVSELVAGNDCLVVFTVWSKQAQNLSRICFEIHALYRINILTAPKDLGEDVGLVSDAQLACIVA